MSDDARWKRFYERRQFERSISAEVRKEREASRRESESQRDRELLVKRHARNNPLCRRLA